MLEPHQRKQSGKLRKVSRQSIVAGQQHYSIISTVASGIDNAQPLDTIDPDDELKVYRQTPTTLCNYRIKILKQMALGYGVNTENSVCATWRKTWNIGAWRIGNKVSLSINLIQPNISSSWINIASPDIDRVQQIANDYNSYKLPSSSCKVIVNNNDVQVQGRWSLDLVDTLTNENTINDKQVSIASLNIGQTKLFCWLVIDKSSIYLCTLTKDSLSILIRYIPSWCADIEEVSTGGSISLKIKSTDNDATQLIIGSSGTVQYQGTTKYLSKLPEALSIALRSVAVSVHLQPFLDSMEYKVYDGSAIELLEDI